MSGFRARAPRGAIVVSVALVLALAACGSGPAEPTGPRTPGPAASGPARSPGASPAGSREPSRTAGPSGTAAPDASGAAGPIETAFAGALPQSTVFAGVRFTITAAGVTNLHPYTMFGTPRPGPDLYGVLQVSAENTNTYASEYNFRDEAFSLRTWSGRILPSVHHPGVRTWSRLDAGETAEDEIVFGLPEPDALDGAALLIGSGDDTRGVIPLSTSPAPPEIPGIVAPVAPGPVHVVPIEWVVERGAATFDAPARVRVRAGLRANEGLMFVSLTVTGTVKGSRYGRATVSTDLLRLEVAGESVKPIGFEGKANVPEGTAYTFDAVWLVSADARSFDLRVGDPAGEPGTISLALGG